MIVKNKKKHATSSVKYYKDILPTELDHCYLFIYYLLISERSSRRNSELSLAQIQSTATKN